MCRWEALHPPPLFSNLQENWSKVSHTATRELATVFSVTFFNSNNSFSIGGNAPPQQKVSQHVTGFRDLGSINFGGYASLEHNFLSCNGAQILRKWGGGYVPTVPLWLLVPTPMNELQCYLMSIPLIQHFDLFYNISRLQSFVPEYTTSFS